MGEIAVRDSEGAEVRAGDVIMFSYGIPPVRVEAVLADRNGKLVALTPEHTPKECAVTQLSKYVSHFYKLQTAPDGTDEVEANLFRSRPRTTQQRERL